MDSELYQKLILEYARDDSHYGSLGKEAECLAVDNPLCGDRIILWVEIDDARISRVRFEARGCIISRASVAIMACLVENRPRNEVLRLIAGFRRELGVGGTEALPKPIDLDDLKLLSGIRKFPARVRCALLGFEALQGILSENA